MSTKQIVLEAVSQIAFTSGIVPEMSHPFEILAPLCGLLKIRLIGG